MDDNLGDEIIEFSGMYSSCKNDRFLRNNKCYDCTSSAIGFNFETDCPKCLNNYIFNKQNDMCLVSNTPPIGLPNCLESSSEKNCKTCKNEFTIFYLDDENSELYYGCIPISRKITHC